MTRHLFLSRPQHDQVLYVNEALLKRAFRTSERTWSLAGVRFDSLPDDLANQLRQTANAGRIAAN
jgi:hypothetical protein